MDLIEFFALKTYDSLAIMYFALDVGGDSAVFAGVQVQLWQNLRIKAFTIDNCVKFYMNDPR